MHRACISICIRPSNSEPPGERRLRIAPLLNGFAFRFQLRFASFAPETRQDPARNTPTSYQKHPSDMRPFICYACFSGPRPAPVRSLKAAKPPPHARWLSMAKGMRRGLPHRWSRIGYLLFRRVLDWRRLPAERVAFAARAQEGARPIRSTRATRSSPRARPASRARGRPMPSGTLRVRVYAPGEG